MGRRPDRRIFREDHPGALRNLVTPEGVSLRFRLAPISERSVALFIDLVIMILAVVLLTVVCQVLPFFRGVLQALYLLVLFAIWNFYFIWFEGRRQGQTPGKRVMRLRVIDRRGGPLTIDAVFARNLTRNLELILPLLILNDPGALVGFMPGWARLLSTVWILVFCLLPLFNRDRLRVGDIVGGTLVVYAPRQSLLADVADRVADQERSAAYTFTQQQLEIYGVYELQVLEQILRERATDQARRLRVVGDQIRKKIGYESTGDRFDERRFLSDFYWALRHWQEQQLLLGKRREFKRE